MGLKSHSHRPNSSSTETRDSCLNYHDKDWFMRSHEDAILTAPPKESAEGSIVDWLPPADAPLGPPLPSHPGHTSPSMSQPMTEHGGGANANPVLYNVRLSQRPALAQRLRISLTPTFQDLQSSFLPDSPSSLLSQV